jgi:hypothetical protein
MAAPHPVPPTAVAGATVFVVAIEHRHGTSFSVCLTQDDADQVVVDWVDRWWENELLPAEAPKPPVIDAVAVTSYFEHVDSESFLIEQVTVEATGPSGPPDPTDADYLRRVFGYGTLDDLAQVLFERLGGAGDVIGAAEIKRRMAAYNPDVLWEAEVGPLLDRLEATLGLGPDRS